MAKISALGLNEWDGTLWDNFVVPEGVSKSDVTNAIMLETADLELLYPDLDTMKAAIGIWSRTELHIWQKLYDTTQLEYNPIWNVDGTEKTSRGTAETEKTDGDSSGSTTAAGTTVNQSNSFNSAQLIDNDKSIDNSNSSSTNSASTDRTRNETENVTVIRQGNTGVTSTQSLIKEEREVSKFCIEDYIVNSFKRRFCLLVY